MFASVLVLGVFLVAHDLLRTWATARYGMVAGANAGHLLTALFFAVDSWLVWVIYRWPDGRQEAGPTLHP